MQDSLPESSTEEIPWWEEEGTDTDPQEESDPSSGDNDKIEPGAPEGEEVQELLNSADLSPVTAQSEDLQEVIEEVLQEVTDEDMGTAQKLREAYDYLVENVQYGSHMRNLGTAVGDVTCADIYYTYGEIEGFGSVALTANVGMCNAYASAFILMARTLGYDAHLAAGSTRSAGGGYAYHQWAEIDIDGVTYVFDPQLEQDLREAGLDSYSVYCKSYDEIGSRYVRSYRVA